MKISPFDPVSNLCSFSIHTEMHQNKLWDHFESGSNSIFGPKFWKQTIAYSLSVDQTHQVILFSYKLYQSGSKISKIFWKTILIDSVSVPISRKKLICSSVYPSNGDFSGLKSFEMNPISDFTNFFDKLGFLFLDWSRREQNAEAKMSLVKLFEQTFVASRSGLIIGFSFSGK